MNEVTLVGTIDGEIKAFSGERSTKASFRLVTSRTFNGKGGCRSSDGGRRGNG